MGKVSLSGTMGFLGSFFAVSNRISDNWSVSDVFQNSITYREERNGRISKDRGVLISVKVSLSRVCVCYLWDIIRVVKALSLALFTLKKTPVHLTLNAAH
jgi:hypothetical protein